MPSSGAWSSRAAERRPPSPGRPKERATIAAGTRIAYVIGELGTGGAEYQLYELVRGLDRRRFTATVLVLSGGGYWAERIRTLGVPVRNP